MQYYTVCAEGHHSMCSIIRCMLEDTIPCAVLYGACWRTPLHVQYYTVCAGGQHSMCSIIRCVLEDTTQCAVLYGACWRTPLHVQYYIRLGPLGDVTNWSCEEMLRTGPARRCYGLVLQGDVTDWSCEEMLRTGPARRCYGLVLQGNVTDWFCRVMLWTGPARCYGLALRGCHLQVQQQNVIGIFLVM